MKKKQIITALVARVDALEKIVNPQGATFVDPDDENKQVFIGIKKGMFTTDVITKSTTTNESNIINQSI
jgi:hypothetical protein